VAPQLGSFEMAKEGEVILEHIAGGSGFQKPWLGSGGDTNRATAREMGTPTHRRLAYRQKFFVDCIREMLRFVLEQAARAGRFSGELDEGNMTLPVYADGKPTKNRRALIDLVEIHAPELAPRDAAAAGQTVLSVAQALNLAATREWVDIRTSQQILATVLAHLGITLDPDSMAIGAMSPQPAPKKAAGGPGTPLAEAARENGHVQREEIDVGAADLE
jgi:hypothetical protein